MSGFAGSRGARPPGRVRVWIKPAPTGSDTRRKYHWDCLCLPHNCGSGWCARDFDHVRLRLDQFSCQCLCSVEVRSHPADIKLKIRSKPPSQLRHPPKEGLHPLLPSGSPSGNPHKHSNSPHAVRLLRLCPNRPRRRTGKSRDELTSPHSITSSARASSDGGTVRPSVLAVLRLMTNSYLVAACTGRSAGFSPLRMRST